MYKESRDTLNNHDSLTTHIKYFGEIVSLTEDQKLINLIEPLIEEMQQNVLDPSVKNKSLPIQLSKSPAKSVKYLLEYCDHCRGEAKPEWQIMAERHG